MKSSRARASSSPIPKAKAKEQHARIRIVLVQPPAGVDYGIQEGRGSVYRTIEKQRGEGKDLHFDCALTIAASEDQSLRLLGPFVQGPPDARFLYIDIGQMAGQSDCPWSRRLKLPLKGIPQEMLKKAVADPNVVLVATVNGTAKDGGPACATVPLLGGWKVTQGK